MLCLVKIKGCRRCGGDLSLECDIYGIYAVCIQCGANWSEAEMMRAAASEPVEHPEDPGRPVAVFNHEH